MVLVADNDPHSIELLHSALGGERIEIAVANDGKGALGELARGIVLFEPFRNPITARELTICVLKAVEHTAPRARAVRRAKKKLSTVEPTMLCVITPSLSSDLVAQAHATLVDAETLGIYRLAPLWRTVIVVGNELPDDNSSCAPAPLAPLR